MPPIPPEDIAEVDAALRAGLVAHRRALLSERRDGGAGRPLAFARRDAEGRVVAGLVGEVALDWRSIDKFWVDDSLRSQGLGKRLLAAAELEAQRLGAIGAHLNTSSFQAPDFYRAQGYVEIGRLEGRPAGHDRLWFAKRF